MTHEDSYEKPYVIKDGKMQFPVEQLPIEDEHILAILNDMYYEEHGAITMHSFKTEPSTEFGPSINVSALFEDGFEVDEEVWTELFIRSYFGQVD